MIKQIMRVINVLEAQSTAFRRRSPRTICVGIIGVNHAARYTSHEGSRIWKTDGKARPHPIQEAPETETRLRNDAALYFDEFLILRFAATNESPYEFDGLVISRPRLITGLSSRESRTFTKPFSLGESEESLTRLLEPDSYE